ncbi:MAG: hypothetical protein WCJ64_04695 [Rhodospirillaceae bacterium]
MNELGHTDFGEEHLSIMPQRSMQCNTYRQSSAIETLAKNFEIQSAFNTIAPCAKNV